MFIRPAKRIREALSVPGDKSISHRSIMFSSIATGESKIYNFLMGEDCLSTIDCFQKLGVNIDITEQCITIQGVGLRGLKKPSERLYAGNSGTTIRLISGILSGQNFDCEITGDASIQRRPMGRIVEPLREMGANICGIEKENHAPLMISGGKLRGIHYNIPVASAQVKSAIQLAGLYAEGITSIQEPQKSRNHTEIMLKNMGADIEIQGLKVICKPVEKLFAREIHVPGDISSAAFFMVLGAIAKDGEILIKDVGLNPTRTGVIDILRKMGADIKIIYERSLSGELVGDILIKTSSLRGVEIGGEIVPRLIDEIPVLAVAACFAEGTTVIRDAQELKVKESNRIKAMVTELKKIGGDIDETADGMIIQGRKKLHGGQIESYHDHRIAMALAIAGLRSEEGVIIDNPSCVDISFPHFFDILHKMTDHE
ncbi:3-phosphoshikimate 1-carboxyvinyltransferase [Anaerosolibacter carboniphilus]|uniref:3-phosphoshikimate 1-carboxyvinyltransferase n=1 Tax=Anaerosolibacter carboniphilus TaxID=1417629 RepID=A0A841L5G7_9FIRM|nr:3-phosphoshikimate 1-carboxyvinyltransferase [Anaerosolibacter carboniphilus]MBB6217659.1 3-phosphoshikimate 1-carboxyvinyltransferase [Anaerosolibacter carboniphilus]